MCSALCGFLRVVDRQFWLLDLRARVLNPKKRPTVRSYDVTGVLMALKKAGFCPAELWVGSVRIVLDPGGQVSDAARSPAREIQDELAKHFANARF